MDKTGSLHFPKREVRLGETLQAQFPRLGDVVKTQTLLTLLYPIQEAIQLTPTNHRLQKAGCLSTSHPLVKQLSHIL